MSGSQLFVNHFFINNSTPPPFLPSCLSCLRAWWYPSNTSSSLVQTSVTATTCGFSLSIQARNSFTLLLRLLAFVYQHFSLPLHETSSLASVSSNDPAPKNHVCISPLVFEFQSKFLLQLPFFWGQISGQVDIWESFVPQLSSLYQSINLLLVSHFNEKQPWLCLSIIRCTLQPLPQPKDPLHPGAHTGFCDGRSTGLKDAMGPKVTPPKKAKTPRIWSTIFGVGPYFLIFYLSFI